MAMKHYREILVKFHEENNRLPSYAEMLKLFGYKSKNGVHGLVQKLIAEGIVKKDRTGKIVPSETFGEVPMLGLVEAGFPSPAEEELVDTISFDEYLTPHKESSYILKVKGDSMIEAGICEGDMVIVERRRTASPGQIVIASVDGEYTMKYLRKKGTTMYLEPANKKYKPIYAKDTLKVEAVVTAVVRKY
jgi:SOS regulatory protein LexA